MTGALSVILAACSLPSNEQPLAPFGQATPTAVIQPERCRGDGAVQTWLLLPVAPLQSELMTAYQAGQVIEFQATIVGQDDDPALQPHRRFLLREAAEGITLTLDYQGDPPPLVQGQSYRLVAWADLLPAADGIAAATPADDPRAAIPDSRGYEMQVYDSQGLLFLGVTDVTLEDDVLDIGIEDLAGECVLAPVVTNPCVASRQVLPLRVQWGSDAIELYPGEDGQLQHDGALYSVAIFRNRLVNYVEPACAGYHEHQRSLRIDRIDPPPELPAPPTPMTATLPLTGTVPLPDLPPTPANP